MSPLVSSIVLLPCPGTFFEGLPPLGSCSQTGMTGIGGLTFSSRISMEKDVHKELDERRSLLKLALHFVITPDQSCSSFEQGVVEA